MINLWISARKWQARSPSRAHDSPLQGKADCISREIIDVDSEIKKRNIAQLEALTNSTSYCQCHTKLALLTYTYAGSRLHAVVTPSAIDVHLTPACMILQYLTPKYSTEIHRFQWAIHSRCVLESWPIMPLKIWAEGAQQQYIHV